MPLSVLVLQSNESKLKDKVSWIGKDVISKVTTRAPFPGKGAAQDFIDVSLFTLPTGSLLTKNTKQINEAMVKHRDAYD